jgi:hypothetical protein
VLSQGCIVESGTPADLLRTDGMFARWMRGAARPHEPLLVQRTAVP